MQIDRKDIGYSIYSRLEEALRSWVRDVLINFGDDWSIYIPSGIWEKVEDKSSSFVSDRQGDPINALEETDIPDLSEIVCYKNSYNHFVPQGIITQDTFQSRMISLYDLRCKIAHVKKSFTAFDLDLLTEISNSFLSILGTHGDELRETLDCLKTNPTKVVVHIPTTFISECEQEVNYMHNLPSSDYDPDGGFIGRKDDLKKIKALIHSDLDRVITISGAGGVGKTALAHRFCVSLLQQSPPVFDAIVWISAKEEKLTLTGIEPIEPTVRNYEELLNNIIAVYGWIETLESNLSRKEEDVNLILQASDRGILLVVDNLETIQDERIKEFIKDIPRPNKVLITSRMGLGEVERRYALKEMSKTDAVTLIRTIAREKGADSLVRLPDGILYKYAQKMSSYPLAIKWVVGQVALGKDIDRLVDSLSSTSGDIARFCFEHIYDSLLSDNAKMVLCSLASSDAPLARGVLTHASGLQTEELDQALRDLALASLILQEQEESKDHTITTKFSLLPLTLGYLRTKLQSKPELLRTIQSRLELVGGHLEEATRAGKQYRYALQYLGATTDEEKIAASWALTAYQRSQMGDYSGSIDAFKRAVEIAPNFSRVYRNWATVESAEGYHERANELMEKATALTPEDTTLWFVWGNMEKRRGRFERSRKFFQKALALSPNDGAVLGGLGEVEKRIGNFEEADIYFEKALKATSDVQSYKHEVITHTAIADNLCRWAGALWKDKRLDEAIAKAKLAYDHATRAVQMAGTDIRAHDTLRETAFQLAMLLSETEDINESIPYFKKAIVTNPKRTKERNITSLACYHLSHKLLQQGNMEEARNYYRIGEKFRLRTEKDRELYDALRTELYERRLFGKISYVPDGSSYGFIERDDTPGQSVFVHRTAFIPAISGTELKGLIGTRVEFNIEKTDEGLQARNVKIL